MSRLSRVFKWAIAWLVAGVVAAALIPNVRERVLERTGFATRSEGGEAQARSSAPRPPSVALTAGRDDVVVVPEDVARALGIRTADVRAPSELRKLSLSGSLALDANRLARVHPRFDGEVVEIGTVVEPDSRRGSVETPSRPIRFGDEIKEGQVLAVLWSTALGEKKSEYVDALSQLRLEQETLARLERLLKDQAVPERNVREAKRAVEADEIAVVRVERTLLSWRLTDVEIASLKAEAEQMHGARNSRDKDRERSWARLEVRAPFAGTVVEKNVAVGDIVAANSDLFKIADLQHLAVWAHIYEEDLPPLLALPAPVRWTIRLKSDPSAEPLTGVIDEIGDIIDPNQHTALVMGHVENLKGRLRAGQFITASIPLPPDPSEVEIPTSALVEDGEESVVFVQPDAAATSYELRPVVIIRHTSDVAFVRATREGAKPSVDVGDRVVASGALELRASLRELRAAVRDSR